MSPRRIWFVCYKSTHIYLNYLDLVVNYKVKICPIVLFILLEWRTSFILRRSHFENWELNFVAKHRGNQEAFKMEWVQRNASLLSLSSFIFNCKYVELQHQSDMLTAEVGESNYLSSESEDNEISHHYTLSKDNHHDNN